VKKSFRILGVTVLTAIYCFAISIVTAPAIHGQIQNTKKTEQEKYFSDATSNLFFHTSGSESFVNSFTSFLTPVFKNTSVDLWAIVNTKELLFEAKYSQYTLFSGNFLISYRKSVIIFPFHYFW
jgi:preprotein translocase subunit SecG